jgi:hypothetical protein
MRIEHIVFFGKRQALTHKAAKTLPDRTDERLAPVKKAKDLPGFQNLEGLDCQRQLNHRLWEDRIKVYPAN